MTAPLRHPFDRHIDLVDQVAAIAPPPKAWAELRDRYDGLLGFHETPMLDKLIEAVVNGDGDVPQLRALALAEGLHERAETVIAVRTQVYPRLIQAYAKVADANYAKVAAEFDHVAGEFATAAVAGNPEASGESIFGQPDPVRTGWLDAAKHAADLNRLTPILVAAAELCGINAAADDTWLLALVIDTAGLHRRRVWEAWRVKGGRCGHWAALAALGAQIRAADLDSFEPYREPRPLIRKQFPRPGPGNRGLYDVVIVDPEDGPDTPQVEEPKPRRKALAR